MPDTNAWAGFQSAIYEVFSHKGTLRLHLGKPCPALRALLDRHETDRAAFVTAFNPAATRLSDAENDRRAIQLRQRCAALGYPVLPGRGGAPDWGWEDSLLIFDIGPSSARRLGREFGQDAILVTDDQQRMQLQPCADPIFSD